MSFSTPMNQGGSPVIRSGPPSDRPPAPVDAAPSVVLVIEDERPVREMFRRSLLFAGFNVLVASGGKEGLTMLETEPSIAVVLLDLNMPYFDGRKVRATQLSNPRISKIPTIVVTGLQLTHVDHEQLQAAEYLAKPVSRERLVAVVGRYCKSAAD
jgi:CheY-like chemotaxis protein